MAVAQGGSDAEDENRSHIGLGNVKTRLKEMLNGELVIHSKKGEGTVVRMLLPKEQVS